MTSFAELPTSELSWEVELSTRCNSRCVGCSRLSHYYHPNPFYQPNLDLDPELLFRALDSTSRPKGILFCGVYGDPLLHPRFLEIMERLDPALPVSVHSNASFGAPAFWKALAPFFNRPGRHIQFALDGEAREHENFRRGTSWEKCLRNAELFIEAGGRAIWKMVKFTNNAHQVEGLRALAASKNFLRFELRPNNYPGLDRFLELSPPANPPSEVHERPGNFDEERRRWELSYLDGFERDSVECKSLSRRSLYLDVHGAVWPCCWLGGLPFRPEHFQREGFRERVLDRYPAGFNLLKEHSLREILEHEWFREALPESWRDRPETPGSKLIPLCAKTCGKCARAQS